MDVAREPLFHRVGLFVGQSLHADHGLALVENLHPPIDPRLAVGLHFQRRVEHLAGVQHYRMAGLRRELVSLRDHFQALAVQFERHLHTLLTLQIVVNDGRKDHLVALHEEPRDLEADDQILAGNNVGEALSDAGSLAHPPNLDPPSGQILGHLERDLGRAVLGGGQRADPQRGVGELRPHGRLYHRRPDPFAAG